ncbi:hypothetical protein QLQ15_12055 [Lysobacter sp. LF1]|uniref:Transmembrane protein n=1 Tax=Lysobacter stagni TaxID=3045172 RepID=A0ABT6XHJ7_9GAMM|nr:hypothetical protein [Lysobacter sp. LF1]MDI9239637.1 hypothetical protein [Lysobacter sp. LF1]
MDLSMWIMGIYLVMGLLGLFLFRAGALKNGIDSPSPAWRYTCRFFTYGFCNLLSCFISPAIYGAFFEFERGEASMPELVLLLGPMPLAVLFYLGATRMMRAGQRRERSLQRRLGLLPTFVPGRPPPEVRSRGGDFKAIDVHDPEMVRELARRHWQELNHALASNGDPSQADLAQRAFLDAFVPTLAPELRAKVHDAYMQESEEHLKEFARLSALRRDRVRDQMELRRRIGRRAYVLLGVLIGGWLLLALWVSLS